MNNSQGDLESRVGEADMSGKFIGDLHYARQGGAPVLIIGHHILHGKVVDMAKPFVAIEKCERDTEDEARYRVKAIIRKKVVFKTRPKPIIAQVPKKV